jgi:hypothetical protein
MRSILLVLLLAPSACAQMYSELDLMADQVRVTSNNLEFSPRLTVGYENEDLGARVRYWHLDTTVNQFNMPTYRDDLRYQFDVADLEAYKQVGSVRLFGGLRGGYLSFGESTRSTYYPYGYYYPVSYYPTNPVFFTTIDDNAFYSVNSESVYKRGTWTTVVGPTAGLEGQVPIIGNLSANFGVRASLLLADWAVNPGYPWNDNYRIHYSDTLFVPEVYTGLDYRWSFVDVGTKFEVQKWESERTSSLPIAPPTVVGIGATMSVIF